MTKVLKTTVKVEFILSNIIPPDVDITDEQISEIQEGIRSGIVETGSEIKEFSCEISIHEV